MAFLILHSGKGECLSKIESALYSAHCSFNSHNYKEISVEVGLSSEPVLTVSGRDLKDFSFIFFRGFKNAQTQAALVASYARYHNICLVNSGFLLRPRYSKIEDLLLLSLAGVPIVPTVYNSELKKVVAALGLPLVAKENESDRGVGVSRIETLEDLSRLPHGMHYQKYISAKSDVRVLVLGGTALGAIERRSHNTKEFRHNVSLGGSAQACTVTPEVASLACKAALVLGCEFAGVDLIRDPATSTLAVLEVNKCPEFNGFMQATGIDVPNELVNFFLRLEGNLLQ